MFSRVTSECASWHQLDIVHSRMTGRYDLLNLTPPSDTAPSTMVPRDKSKRKARKPAENRKNNNNSTRPTRKNDISPPSSVPQPDSQQRRFAYHTQNSTPPHRRKRPGPTVYIDSVAACRAAVTVLSVHPRIAVDCEGVGLSRTGRLCLMQIASPDHVYIFDIIGKDLNDMAYGISLFEQGGLRELLENTSVHKVMHDCRHDSDALFHQFGVRLASIIDTQVVFTVLRKVRGLAVGLPVSLRTLLRKFAGATEEELEMKNSVKDSMNTNGDFWLQRPLSEQALQYARLDVEHLLFVTHKLGQYIVNADKKGWQQVLKESNEYITMFRDHDDGPRKAQQQYEILARVARRERAVHEQTKRVSTHRASDPMRLFAFDHHSVLHVLQSTPIS